MKIELSYKNVIKNIFRNKLYLIMLILSIFITIILPFTAQKFVLPSFYSQFTSNILDDAKRVGTHISRHQNNDGKSTVFYTTIDKLKEDFNLYKIILFDEKGKIVFSTKTSEVGNINKNSYYFDIVAKGEIFYKIVTEDVQTSEDTKYKIDLAEVYVPIMKNEKFIGSSEIYYDITDKKNKFNKLINKVTFFYYIFSLLFFVVSFVVIYILSKNDLKDLNKEQYLKNIVDEKTKELKRINKNLEDRISNEVEKSIERERKMFQQSKLASMGEMIGNIAHQWRQPLSIISTFASGAKLQKEAGLLDDENLNNTLDKINKTAQQMSKTIDNFKDFLKGDSSKKIFNVSEEIEKCLEIEEGLLKDNHINIIKRIDETIYLNNLPHGLSQILLNIINNSKDAMKSVENESDKLLFIETKKDIKYTIITIKDSGGGIPDNIINKVFEPYFTTKHQSQGTGLGLHMTYKIITENMNGTVEVKNVSYSHNNIQYKGAITIIKLPNE